MAQQSRVYKSLLNARVSLIYYLLFIVLSFFSRKIFLDSLGADFMGLGGTLSNILGFLSLAEMGVGTAVAYNLYRPIEQGNRKKIEELVSVFGYLYRRIGILILIAGCALSLFIPFIFKKTIFDFSLIYFAFFCILSSSLLGYFINYRQILLTADQKGYVVSVYLQGAGVVKTLLQMFFAYKWGNYYVWIVLELLFSFLGCVVLNYKIRQTYPWLHASVAEGKKVFSQYRYLISFTKQVFVHKIKDFLLNQSDQILIFAFVSLKMVAYYGNYTLVITRVSSMFESALGSFTAGVGNLVAEGNNRRSQEVFWEIVSLRFFVAGFLIFSVYNLIEPFIMLWLGKQYVMDHTILILLLVTVFISQTRGAVDMFNTAFGHYADTWSAWAELILNVGVTLSTAPFLGIAGILLGKIVSTFIIIIVWKPYYLFKVGFRRKMSAYWMQEIRYYLTFVLAISLSTMLFNVIPIDASTSFFKWTLKGVITVPMFIVVYITMLYASTQGTRDLVHRVVGLITKKFSK